MRGVYTGVLSVCRLETEQNIWPLPERLLLGDSGQKQDMVSLAILLW